MSAALEFICRLEQSGLATERLVALKGHLCKLSTAEEVADALVQRKLLTRFQSSILLGREDVPLIIGNYLVIDKIGKGGMGLVLKARHQQMNRDVAIKFLLSRLVSSDILRQRFQREIQMLAQVRHENIVTAYDAGVSEQGNHFLVMEYVDGQDLGRLIKRNGTLSIGVAIDLCRQAALGLGHAHRQGIIHRDVKPSNLMVDSQGKLRIFDLGLARFKVSPTDSTDEGEKSLTQSGSIMGTIDFMAPEQALDARTADYRSDIYSLGCVLYYMLTGNPPFPSTSLMRGLLAHLEAPIPVLRQVRPESPPELDVLLHEMLSKRREDRFQSMDEVVVALDTLDLDDVAPEAVATITVPDSDLRDWMGQMRDAMQPANLSADVAAPAPRRSTDSASIVPASLGHDAVAISFASPEEPTKVVAQPSSSIAQADSSFNDGSSDLDSSQIQDSSDSGTESPTAIDDSQFAVTQFADEQPTNPSLQREMIGFDSGTADARTTDSAAGEPEKRHTFVLPVAIAVGIVIAGLTAQQFWPPRARSEVDSTVAKLEPQSALETVQSDAQRSPNTRADEPQKQQLDETVTSNSNPQKASDTPTSDPKTSEKVPDEPKPPVDHALGFDGQNSYVEIPDLPIDLTQPLTIEIMVERRTGRSGPIVVAPGVPGFNISQSGPRLLAFEVHSQGQRFVRVGTVEEFNGEAKRVHLAAVWRPEPPSAMLFINGQMVVEEKEPDPVTERDGQKAVTVLLGKDQALSFKGRLDELRISKVARYDADYEPSTRFETDPDTIALYHCDEGMGTILRDELDRHHGVIHRATWDEARTP